MYLEIFLIGILAALSPGPDFVVVMKNSLGMGRKNGMAAALGIASALIVHVSYTVLGFTIILEKWPFVFNMIKLLGAVYLLWLGFQGIRSKAKSNELHIGQLLNRSAGQSFREGFLCNILNPKSALFFLSIFSQFIGHSTPEWMRWIYGGEIILAVGLWFILLAILISNHYFRGIYRKYMHWFDRGLGVILIIFAVTIGVTAFSS
ncbi:LysE family translocator [Bacillus norwichensis]|uniref:LysE family transporter n=1 Tax=Bacillus norwichensis TaxID=2762217 RepID=A0ABR8VPR5_9BACI|nr:LysE family transporter [Bacillus norwichensis]MBD8006738.1 LysE family transporter [Bacillus norwichensis]